MNRKSAPPFRRAALLPAGLAVVTLLLTLFAADMLRGEMAETRRELDDIGQRHARLAGLHESASELARTSRDAEAMLAALAYPAETGVDRVGSDVQQRMRNLAQTHGLEMVGSQIMPSRVGDQVQSIPVMTILDGDLGAMHGFLSALGHTRPVVRVEEVGIQPLQSRPGQVQDTLRMQLTLIAVQLQ